MEIKFYHNSLIPKRFRDLEIPKIYKKFLAQIAAGQKSFLRMTIDPEFYKNKKFENPDRFKNDPDYIETLAYFGEIESDNYAGIPANVPRDIERIFGDLKLVWKKEYKNGKLEYAAAKNYNILKKIENFRIICK